MAMFSVRVMPSPVTSTGKVARGFTARNSGCNCAPSAMLMSRVSMSSRFSAMNIRARRGLGAVEQS